MSIHGISRNNLNKAVKIESQSVNSVLLDTDPNDYHERQGNICPYFNMLISHIL